MLTYVNMNMKKTKQGYGARLYLKLMLKEMKGPTSIYTPLGIQLKEVYKEAYMCASSKETF